MTADITGFRNTMIHRMVILSHDGRDVSVKDMKQTIDGVLEVTIYIEPELKDDIVMHE